MKTKTKRKITKKDLEDWHEDIVTILNECLSSEPNMKLIESKCHDTLYELNWLLSGKDPFEGELELTLQDPAVQREIETLDNQFEDDIRGKIYDILENRLKVFDVRVIDDLKKLVLKVWSRKSKTEEIQYLGQMLAATTAEDKDRINSIIKRLEEINE